MTKHIVLCGSLLLVVYACGSTAINDDNRAAAVAGAGGVGVDVAGAAGGERAGSAGGLGGSPELAGAGGQGGVGADPVGGQGGVSHGGAPQGGAPASVGGFPAAAGDGGAGGAPGSLAGAAGAGGEHAEPDPVPPWKRCGNGKICGPDEVCAFTKLDVTPTDERACFKYVGDPFDRCVPTLAHPTVQDRCNKVPGCEQVWSKCGVLSIDDAGHHCGNPFDPIPYPGSGQRYSCGPPP